MIMKLDVFEFGTYEEAVSRRCKRPTTTEWVEGWEADDKGGRFVRWRLVGGDFKVKGVEGREAAVRGQRRRRGLEEVKLVFIDVRKAHLNARCEEEEWVELLEEFWEFGTCARLRRCEGFRRGKGVPTVVPAVCFNAKTAVSLVVHGDNFTHSGMKKDLEKI